MSLILASDSITQVVQLVVFIFILLVVIVLVQLYRTNKKMAAKLGVEPNGISDFLSFKNLKKSSAALLIGSIVMALAVTALLIAGETYLAGDQLAAGVLAGIGFITLVLSATLLFTGRNSKSTTRPPPPQVSELDTQKKTDTVATIKTANETVAKSELERTKKMLNPENLKSVVYCSSCGKKNDSDAVFCNNCGVNVFEASSTSAEVFCNNCGTKNSKTAKYCKKCGKKTTLI